MLASRTTSSLNSNVPSTVVYFLTISIVFSVHKQNFTAQ